MMPTVATAPGKTSSLRFCFLFSLTLAGLLLPLATRAQVSYTGTAANLRNHANHPSIADVCGSS